MFFWRDSDHVDQPKTSGCKISHVRSHCRWHIFTINAKGFFYFLLWLLLSNVQYKNEECYSNMWEDSTFLMVNSAGWLGDLKLAAVDGTTQELMSPVSKGLTAKNKWANKKQSFTLLNDTAWMIHANDAMYHSGSARFLGSDVLILYKSQVELKVWATATAPYLKHSGGAKLLQFYRGCDGAIVLHPLARPTKYVSFVQNFFGFKQV